MNGLGAYPEAWAIVVTTTVAAFAVVLLTTVPQERMGVALLRWVGAVESTVYRAIRGGVRWLVTGVLAFGAAFAYGGSSGAYARRQQRRAAPPGSGSDSASVELDRRGDARRPGH